MFKALPLKARRRLTRTFIRDFETRSYAKNFARSIVESHAESAEEMKIQGYTWAQSLEDASATVHLLGWDQDVAYAAQRILGRKKCLRIWMKARGRIRKESGH